MFGLDSGFTILLLVCLLAACAFEFINGFHDTANAVATVIYTHSLKPWMAVIWSGIWNFIGVNVGGIAVAIGIINLLPIEVLVDQNLGHNVAMILAMIIAAIAWNLLTWYYGIPCSSSHTLIGSIFGVGLAFMFLPGGHPVALNWIKVIDAGLALLISPVIGFYFAFLLMMLLKRAVRNKKIFKEPPKKKPPPLWIRSIMIGTSTLLSYAHGSNDGQKGVGLVMLILIGFAPSFFALDRTKTPAELLYNTKQIEWTLAKVDTGKLSPAERGNLHLANLQLDSMKILLKGVNSFSDLTKQQNHQLRNDILVTAKKTDELIKIYRLSSIPGLTPAQISVMKSNLKNFRSKTEYAPRWVILIVSVSLGLGTMIGWKRIVVTIGEQIGKTHMTYAQGASANLIAASTIWASSILGLPVSTTHVLSSGVAGTMVAGKGKQNLKKKTVQNILVAWFITLPVTIVLAGGLFLLFRLIWV